MKSALQRGSQCRRASPRVGAQQGGSARGRRRFCGRSGRRLRLKAETIPTFSSWCPGDRFQVTGCARLRGLDQSKAGEQSPSVLTPDDPAHVPCSPGPPCMAIAPPCPTSSCHAVSYRSLHGEGRLNGACANVPASGPLWPAEGKTPVAVLPH